jgi:predicted transcriptional regulator
MRVPKEVIQSKETIAQALERLRNSEFHAWPVIDERGIIGVISLAALQRAHSEGTAEKTTDQLLDHKPFPHFHDDQSLELALQRLGQSGMDVIPVVSRANVRELVGIITLSDILKRYGVAGESP